MNYEIHNKINLKEVYSIKGKLLCIFFFLATSTIYFFPDSITNLFKPTLIVALLFVILLSNERLQINKITLLTILAIVYYLIVFLSNSISFRSFVGFSWLILCLTITMIISTLKYTEKDMKSIINSLYIGGFLFAFCILISNPNISNMNAMNRMEIKYLNTYINANGISYIIVTSILIGLNKIILSNKINKFKHILMVCIMLYPIFYSMSRGGFLSLFFGALLIIIYYFKHFSIKVNLIKVISIMLTLSILVLLISAFIPDDIKNRLFSFTSYELNNRDFLWKQAFSLAKTNIFFGNGYSFYWENTGYAYGSHNLYIDLLVSTGLIGSFLMIFILINIIYRCKNNLILISFLVTPIVNSMVESGNSYSFWIPLILTIICIKYTQNNKKDIKEIFISRGGIR